MEFFDAALSKFYANRPPNASFELNLATLLAHFFHPDHVDVPSDPNKPAWNYAMGAPVQSDILNKISIAEYFDNIITLLKTGGITLQGKNYTINGGKEIKYNKWEVLKQDEHGFSTVDYAAIFKSVYDSLNNTYPNAKTRPSLAALGGATCGRIHPILTGIDNLGARTNTISLHHRCIPGSRTNVDSYVDIFDDMERFVRRVKARVTNYLNDFWNETNKKVKIEVSDASIYLPGDRDPRDKNETGDDIPDTFWLAAATGFASLFTQLSTNENITNINMGLYSAYPAISKWNIADSFLPSLSLTNWENGKPNMKYRLVELLSKYFYSGLPVAPFNIYYDPTSNFKQNKKNGNAGSSVVCLTSDSRNGFEKIIIKCDSVSLDPINFTSVSFGALETDICGSLKYNKDCSYQLPTSTFDACAAGGECTIDPLNYINSSICPERRVSFTVTASCPPEPIPAVYLPIPSLSEQLDVLAAYIPPSGTDKEAAHILVVNKRSSTVSTDLSFKGIEYNTVEMISLNKNYNPESGEPQITVLNSLKDVVFPGFSTSVIILRTA